MKPLLLEVVYLTCRRGCCRRPVIMETSRHRVMMPSILEMMLFDAGLEAGL